MEMRKLNTPRVCEILNEIIELEMAGVFQPRHPRDTRGRPGDVPEFIRDL